MDNLNKDFLIQHGFIEDVDKKVLSEVFNSNTIFKQFDIEISITTPSMLLARVKGKKISVGVVIDNGQQRIIAKQNDKFKTSVLNIVVDEIHDCLYKKTGDNMYQFTYEINNMCYTITAII